MKNLLMRSLKETTWRVEVRRGREGEREGKREGKREDGRRGEGGNTDH